MSSTKQEQEVSKAARWEAFLLLKDVPEEHLVRVVSFLKATMRWDGTTHPDETLLFDLTHLYGLGLLTPESAKQAVDEYGHNFTITAIIATEFLDRHPEIKKDLCRA